MLWQLQKRQVIFHIVRPMVANFLPKIYTFIIPVFLVPGYYHFKGLSRVTGSNVKPRANLFARRSTRNFPSFKQKIRLVVENLFYPAEPFKTNVGKTHVRIGMDNIFFRMDNCSIPFRYNPDTFFQSENP